jgi:hypothetical protein
MCRCFRSFYIALIALLSEVSTGLFWVGEGRGFRTKTVVFLGGKGINEDETYSLHGIEFGESYIRIFLQTTVFQLFALPLYSFSP